MSTTNRFAGKNILIGLCGGIAAYKACDLLRQLYREGAQKVQVILTESAKAFVTPLTLETLTTQPVLESALQNNAQGVPLHIALAQEFDLFLILPATANTMAKLAHGMADDLLSTTAITFTNKPIVIAPAMNSRMWENPLVAKNIEALRGVSYISFVEPEWGNLACGETGEGKLAQQELVLAELYRRLHSNKNLYAGQKMVITGGGTSEPIDAVRYMTNRSSGKMGIALADEAHAMGADVLLIHTLPELAPKPYTTQFVKTVDEMAHAVHTAMQDADGLVMSAAVSDFKVADPLDEKIKKKDSLNIHLQLTRDILVEASANKKAEQFLIGFAAESTVDPERLREKLQRKNLDLLVCNDISRADIGFAAEQNEVHLLFADGTETYLPKADKHCIAREILSQFKTQKTTTTSTEATNAVMA